MNSAQTSEQFEHSLLKAINQASPDGILVVDAEGRIISANRRFIEIWGLEGELRAEVEAMAPHTGINDERVLEFALQKLKDPQGFLRRVEELYENPALDDYTEIELLNGIVLERHSVGLFDESNGYLGRVWFFRDISRQKNSEAQLRFLAWHDPLTLLMNRAHFMHRANEELARARRYQRPLALLLLDLDHFKRVNDDYGHLAGDEVLASVSKRWQSELRNIDLIGRIGGEEFVVLLPENDLAAARIVAERLLQAVSGRNFYSEGRAISCTVSCGIAILGQETHLDELLRRADQALYRAKDKGRNRVEN